MTNEQHNVQIRNASLQDVDLLTDIEAACFPAAEAATKETFAQRLQYYARYFWIIEVNGTAAGFIDGFVTNQKTLPIICLRTPLCTIRKAIIRLYSA